jgi:hypothetical protein
MTKVKIMKDMFENKDCVGVFFLKKIYQIHDQASAPPFVTMTTYCNIFEVFA